MYSCTFGVTMGGGVFGSFLRLPLGRLYSSQHLLYLMPPPFGYPILKAQHLFIFSLFFLYLPFKNDCFVCSILVIYLVSILYSITLIHSFFKTLTILQILIVYQIFIKYSVRCYR